MWGSDPTKSGLKKEALASGERGGEE